jgi:ATP-dependent DNA helicase RecQ
MAQLPQKPDEEEYWLNEILPNLDTEEFVHLLFKLQSEEGPSDRVWLLLNEFFKQRVNLQSKMAVEGFETFIQPFFNGFPKFELEESNFSDTNPEVFLELFDRKILKRLSNQKVKSILEFLSKQEDQISFIKRFPVDQSLEYFDLVESLFAQKQEFLKQFIEAQVAELNVICFDLEVREGEIKEYAWHTKGITKSNSDYLNFSQGLRDLVYAIKTSDLIIGQNVKEFDLPYLIKLDREFKESFVWDTLEIEMLLNPCRRSFGLLTKHSAEFDTEQTFQLFINQILRVNASEEKYQSLKLFLPEQAVYPVEQKFLPVVTNHVDILHLERESNKFFRTQDSKSFPVETLGKLEEAISINTKSIIFLPEFLWGSLAEQFGLSLISKNRSRSWVLSKDLIESESFDNRIIQGILLSFINAKEHEGRIPYLEQLPQAIRVNLSEAQLVEICTIPESSTDLPLAVFLEELDWLSNAGIDLQDYQVIVIGEEISRLTTKIQLGQNFDFNTIFEKFPKQEPLWLQLSGGKNYFSLEKRHLGYLGINDVPDKIKSIWIEKADRSQFKVFCNLNIQARLQSFYFQGVTSFEFLNLDSRKTQAFILKPDLKNSRYSAEAHRVNSESLYRDKYWVYQFKIFGGILGSTEVFPKVLIVNDSEEIGKLNSYARAMGYFVPDERSTLIRQLEILHAHRSVKKLLVVPLGKLSKLVSENHVGPLNFIWDSFLLQETFQLLKSDFENGIVSLSDEGNTDKDPELKITDNRIDTFTLIKAQKPLIDFYYWMIHGNHPDSKLYISDTRLSDYFGIESVFKVGSIGVRLWNNEDQYQSDFELASRHFPSKNKSQKIELDLDEAKDLLRYVFLMPEEGETPYDWRDYQHPYLNEILEAKKDLLISLPTGAGKSVLFQAPALFRSGYSNKLTLVVVPLRALMQDQVDGLWNKGFYSNVDFISGDKSYVEIKDIYRRVSGGEINMLFITPEWFRARAFENCLLSRITSDDGLEFAVFDEAHCISQWGLDFRPDYMNAARKVSEYSERFSMKKLLFSATISEQVSRDINRLLGQIELVEGAEKNYNPVRDHIKMNFKHNVVDDERLSDLANYLKKGNFNPQTSRAIFFVKSRKKVEESALLFSEYLEAVFGEDCSFKDKIGAFHAGMDAEDRRETYDKYKSGELVILFATKAFGMGMDIPNIHFVGHLSPSSTFEDFLQEIGRAGRNEEQRKAAGFDTFNNPINTLCLTSTDDFSTLKDQLLDSRISWHEVKEIKTVVENYIKKFRPLESASELPVAISFDLYTKEKGTNDEDLSTNFRLGLHWLEKLGRIRLGYFTLTHLELFTDPLKDLGANLSKSPDEDIRKVCEAIWKLYQNSNDEVSEEKDLEEELFQVSLTTLREESRLGLSNLYKALYNAHNLGLIKINQEILIEPTKLRIDEISHGVSNRKIEDSFPVIHFVFSLVRKVLSAVPLNDSKVFEGEELDFFVSEALEEIIDFQKLPWSKKEKEEAQAKEIQSFKKDIIQKRAKHAFTLIRLLGKTRHESKMKKSIDSRKKAVVIQSVFNGYHKKEEWSHKLSRMEKDVIALLQFVASSSLKKNVKSFNWPDLINSVHLNEDVNYLSDLLFILSVLGYCKSGSLFPSGIEVYLESIDPVDETDLQTDDSKIFNEFEESRKVRELKLIALEVLAGFQKNKRIEHDPEVRKKQDSFIRKYFICESLDGLLNLLQEELTPDHPLLTKWRGDAIKFEEDRLNQEQRKVYHDEVNQHISVMAGPGSGKTHTLTLRVARLVHHVGISPDEILVLAYNRAVVSELKDRLGKLFGELGYGKLSKRLKIFTFHGLSKRYCKEKLIDKDFGEWESTLLATLKNSPGEVFAGLGNLKHILVDEFQDINTVRVNLLKELQQLTKSHLFIIGDPNQSIYGYEREKEGGSLSPWPYYQDFNSIFNPSIFKLFRNHRSFPKILEVASSMLDLPEDQKDLVPTPVRKPDEDYLSEYVTIFDTTQQRVDWITFLEGLTEEKISGRPYKQIAVLFRTNNEVYRGFQKIRSLKLSGIRIRIQGSLPYEFIRIRECFEIIQFVKSKQGDLVRSKFESEIGTEVNRLIATYPAWNHFYLRVIQSLILEFLSDEEDNLTYSGLLDYLIEMGSKDDGQLFKIYEKYRNLFSKGTDEVEIVLSTMHKVKGLEFDCVVVPPSFSNLPLKEISTNDEQKLAETIEEERRLTYVAYTRARYRLLIFKHKRELALEKSSSYKFPETIDEHLGVPAPSGLEKLILSWSAREYNFRKVNHFIKSEVRSRDLVFINRKVSNDGKFVFHEVHHKNRNEVIGSVSKNSGKIRKAGNLDGFLVNEVVVWTYKDTIAFDSKTSEFDYKFQRDWCSEAIEQGYVYVVDFAGYGKDG